MIKPHSVRIFHFKFRKELSEVYLSHSIRSFAYALVGVFIPAFLISSSYSLKAVAFYYLMHSFFMGVGCIVTSSLFTKIGVKHGILFSGPLAIAQFLMLYSLKAYNWPLTIVALVSGFASAFFWPAFHAIFTKSSDHKHRSEEISARNIFSCIATVFAPLIGGVIVKLFGFPTLFILVSVVLCIAAVPLFFTKERYEKFDFSVREMFSKQKIKDVFVFFSSGVMGYAQTVIWPLFIFIKLNGFLVLGVLSAVSIFVITLVNYLLGKISYKLDNRKVLKFGAIPAALLWLVKPFASVFGHFASINFLEGIFTTLIDVPMMGIFYDKANRTRETMEYIVFREMAYNTIGGGFILLIFLVTESFNFTFTLAGIATYGLTFF